MSKEQGRNTYTVFSYSNKKQEVSQNWSTIYIKQSAICSLLPAEV